MDNLSPVAALYVSWALTGLWPITGKAAGAYADPLVFGAAALLLALLTLLPALRREGRWRRVLDPALLGRYAVIGGIGSGLTTLLLLTAVQHTSSANAAIVGQVEVVYSAILSAVLLGEALTGRQLAASALVVVGTGLVLGQDLGTPHWKGDVLMLIAPWLFQLSHVYSKKLPPSIDPVTIAGVRQVYGSIVLAPVAAIALASGHASVRPAPALGCFLLFHGCVLNAFTNTLWYRAIRNLDLAKTTAVMLSYPGLTLLYCRLLGQEEIGRHQVLGLGVSFAGALWLTWQMRAPRPVPVTAPSAEPA